MSSVVVTSVTRAVLPALLAEYANAPPYPAATGNVTIPPAGSIAAVAVAVAGEAVGKGAGRVGPALPPHPPKTPAASKSVNQKRPRRVN